MIGFPREFEKPALQISISRNHEHFVRDRQNVFPYEQVLWIFNYRGVGHIQRVSEKHRQVS